MKLLIINQPINNRGDESAHRSLVRALNKFFPEAKITVLLFAASQDSVRQMMVENINNEYINIENNIRASFFSMRWGLRLGFVKLVSFHPTLRTYANFIRSSDLVICAPGGICMGLFQNWEHIYWLSLALAFKKEIIYYSRSFGPFPENTKWNRIFKKVSFELLNKFSFLSIRDSKTMKLADEIGVQYLPSIDTAFLDVPRVDIPASIKQFIKTKDYIVFVPNTLTWHPAYVKADKEYIDKFYLAIIELVFEIYTDMNIVMLPQIFNDPKINDEPYFNYLKNTVNSDRIIVISDMYGSDIQQTLISGAKLMIGARYHSIVFAINNNIPFIALSYEHKVSGLLQILDKLSCMYNIKNLTNRNLDIKTQIAEIKNIMLSVKNDEKAQKQAHSIAENCMNELQEYLDKVRTAIT